eukprot:g18373.t1
MSNLSSARLRYVFAPHNDEGEAERNGLGATGEQIGPAAPFPLVSPLTHSNGPACIFSYHVPFWEAGAAQAATSEDAWLYGAVLSKRLAGSSLATSTGSPADVVAGKLLCWWSERFASAQRQWDMHFLGLEAVERGVVRVVTRQGAVRFAYWYYQAPYSPLLQQWCDMTQVHTDADLLQTVGRRGLQEEQAHDPHAEDHSFAKNWHTFFHTKAPERADKVGEAAISAQIPVSQSSGRSAPPLTVEGSRTTLRDWVRVLVPPLDFNKHKGQAGKIGVLGGCALYTGAPYYAGMAALRLGADLATIFCSADAAGPIKAYSPELMVHGVVPGSKSQPGRKGSKHIVEWLDRLHVLLIGPGLGRAQPALSCAQDVLQECRQQATALPPWHQTVFGRKEGERNEGVPVVIDADALWLINTQPDLVRGYTSAVLTPNAMEFRRLWQAVFVSKKGSSATQEVTDELPPMDVDIDAEYAELVAAPGTSVGKKGETNVDGSCGVVPIDSSLAKHTAQLARALGGVTIIRKGLVDVMSDGNTALYCSELGSPKRAGGQGDVLAGTIALFLHWARQAPISFAPESDAPFVASDISTHIPRQALSPTLLAAQSASLLVRRSARMAFSKHGRSMSASHLLESLPDALDEMLGS